MTLKQVYTFLCIFIGIEIPINMCFGDDFCRNISDYKDCPSGLVCKPELLNKQEFCNDIKTDKSLKQLIKKNETCEMAFERLF